MPERKARKKAMALTREDHIVNIVANVFVIIVLLFTLYPLWYTVIIALNENTDSLMGGIYFWPRMFTLDNFKQVLTSKNFPTAVFNSVARTVVGTIFSVTSLMMASYALSKSGKNGLYFRNFYKGILIFAAYVSGGTVPYYLTLHNLKLLNTFWVYVLPSIGVGFFNLMLVQAFMREIPEALEESAVIDGCGYFKCFCRIMLPLCTPIIATMALFAAVSQWNDWFSTLYYTSGSKLMTLAAYLRRLIEDAEAKALRLTSEAYSATKETLGIKYLRYAALVTTILPIITVYPFCQKYFVKGMLVGSVKA